jgi:hypothetical protein
VLSLLLAAWLSQTPPPAPSAAPPVSAPPLVPYSPVAPVPTRTSADVPPAVRLESRDVPPPQNALHFSLLSVFALFAAAEYERALPGRFSVFVGAGVSPLSQLGATAGARAWLSDEVFRGAFFDAHASVFTVLSAGLTLAGGGVMAGWSFRSEKNLIVTLGAGVEFLESSGLATGTFLQSRPTQSAVLALPGVQQPAPGRLAPQPAFRFTVGPGF